MSDRREFEMSPDDLKAADTIERLARMLQEAHDKWEQSLNEIERLRLLVVGVQRPEDVARVKEAFEQQFPQYKRDGFTGGDRQDYETLKAALLALPHTGQPQEGAVAIAMWRKWALSLEPETDGPSEDWIGGFNEALDKIEEALSAAPASPQRAEGELKPHAYVPSTLHMGDCAVCGHLQNAAIHALPAPQAGCAKEGELAEAYECLNVLEDLMSSTLAHLEGDAGYGNRDVILADLRAYRDARMSGRAFLSVSPPPPVAESGWQEIVERVAAIGLWRDYYPDGRDELAGGTLGGHGVTPDDVRKARALVAEKRERP